MLQKARFLIGNRMIEGCDGVLEILHFLTGGAQGVFVLDVEVLERVLLDAGKQGLYLIETDVGRIDLVQIVGSGVDAQKKEHQQSQQNGHDQRHRQDELGTDGAVAFTFRCHRRTPSGTAAHWRRRSRPA